MHPEFRPSPESLKRNKMKKDIHPENYRLCVFQDMSNGHQFLTRSTAPAKETATYEGEEYPLIKLDISSKSHPFFTGKMNFVDTAGRIDKFKNKYARHLKKTAEPKAEAAADAQTDEPAEDKAEG